MAEATKPTKIEVTNNDKGPRYVHTARGAEVIKAGETLSTVAHADQVDAIKDSWLDDDQSEPMFTVKAAKDDGDKGKKAKAAKDKPALEPLDGKDAAALTKIAETEGVDISKAETVEDMVAAIEAKREADAAK